MTKLERTISELYARETELKEALEDLPIKEHAYKKQKAVEFRLASGTEKARAALAEEKCEQELLDYLKADARAALAKQLVEDCRAVLSARQTLQSTEFRNNTVISRNQT